jgi:hypothetical protein
LRREIPEPPVGLPDGFLPAHAFRLQLIGAFTDMK